MAKPHRLPTLVSLLPHVLFTLAAVWVSAAPAAPAAEGGDDATILPFVDEGTFIVVRLDVDRVDQDALAKYMERAIDRTLKGMQFPEDRLARHRQDAMSGIEPTRNWLTRMTEVGGRRLYVLFDQADQQTAGAEGPLVIVPLTGGADAEQVKAELTRPGTGGMAVDQAGDAIVMGQEPAVERVKKLVAGSAKPAARPGLADAFAAAGKDAPVRVAFVPGESTRKWIEQSLPQLPQQLGGGDAKLLSRGVRYASIGISQKPETMARFAIRAADAEQAKALLDVLSKSAQFLKETAMQGPMAAEFAKEVDAVKPQLQGDTIRFGVDPTMVLSRIGGVHVTTPAAQPGQPVPPAKRDDGGL